MTTIPESLRKFVVERARGYCEYCLLHQDNSIKKHEIDHIIAEKHRGTTSPDNLCLSCISCNRYKGSDISSIDPLTDENVRLFNPRVDVWKEHFALQAGEIIGLTPQGRATILLLHFNDEERVIEREFLIALQLYPPPQ